MLISVREITSSLVKFGENEHREHRIVKGEEEEEGGEGGGGGGGNDGRARVRVGSTKFTIHIAAARIFKPLIKRATRMGWRAGYSQM